MICPECKRAGECMTNGDVEEGDRREVIRSWHDKCPAVVKRARTQCDCQHDISQSYIAQAAK